MSNPIQGEPAATLSGLPSAIYGTTGHIPFWLPLSQSVAYGSGAVAHQESWWDYRWLK